LETLEEMKMRKRLLFGSLAALLIVFGAAEAQQVKPAYPTKQVRIVVPYPPGGPTDMIARLLAQKLSERLGQSFYVENVTGASGAVGAGQVAKAAPNGENLLVVTNDFAVASVTNKGLPYDPVKNFTPVTIVASSPQVIAVNPSVPAKSVKELVALINADPEKYNYAALGIGFGALSAERLFKLGLKQDKLSRIPFNGAAPAVTSTLAGQTPIIYMGLPQVAPYIASEKLRPLAVTSAERPPAFPNIPTLKEQGIPSQESELQIGLVAPANTPKDIISLLQKEVSEIVKLPDVKKALETVSFTAVASTPEDYAKAINSDIKTWTAVMKDLNIPQN
jgi:tripartite-type tricarboxylate transporter receptor subunit TctC